MKDYILLLSACFFFFPKIFSQLPARDSIKTDTLEEVVVRAYEQNRELREVAAAVSVITQQQLQRSGVISILPALNATPGVRMEERSPGSYRINIRGSSLRSPFGVRNVKIYWNSIPFTDPGGNTYLNQLGLYNFTSLEILKGPGSSLYGAGTGGVILINSFPQVTGNELSVLYSRGSYQMNNLDISAQAGNESNRNLVSYSHQASEGYRDQSAMRRDVVRWESRIKTNEKLSLSTQILYGDLYYETPGGLTLAQYLANPKAARPAGGGFPGAGQNKAAIYQKTFFAGISQQYAFNEHWQNSTAAYGAFSQIRNPAIRNYEKRLEPHFGGRTTFTFTTNIQSSSLKIVAGAEVQKGYFNIKVYQNQLGNPGPLQTDDEVSNYQAGIFAQSEITFPKGWIATAGLSLNRFSTEFNRLSDVPALVYTTGFSNELAPRFSLLKKINTQLSIYGLVSKGYSPPTVAELLPSTSIINTDLKAEHGINYELGSRGNFFNNRLSVDVNAFYFRLQNAITQRRDASGADYFVNAGSTRQHGVETAVRYIISRNKTLAAAFWLSYTYHRFLYKNFKQLEVDFSGNQLPGVSPHTVAAGLDLSMKNGLYANLTYYYSDRNPLNDANAAFASSYNLSGFKTGYKRMFGKHFQADFFIGGDNLFNQNYSLGNDINAAANRFYNAAPGVNYMAGIEVKIVGSR